MGEEFCPFTGVECLSIGRQNNCPIICSLPEGHGRLIDADALNLDHKVEMAVEMAVDWKTAHMISNVVKYAPTIVPAEAERSET